MMRVIHSLFSHMHNIILTCAILSFAMGFYLAVFFLPLDGSFLQSPPVISGTAIMFISFALFAAAQHMFLIEKEAKK